MRLPDHAPPLFMVFDVESVGLHGEGFAVAWVVVDRSGEGVASAAYSCDPSLAVGDDEGREWVAENVTVPPAGRKRHPAHVRDEFWRAWEDARSRGATLWAECCWPVEANFLSACVADDPGARRWAGPYPLHDVASVRLAAGLDPLATVDRLPDELPAHNPLADARQSARLLIEALSLLARPGPEQP
jgi:hypothetical protein